MSKTKMKRTIGRRRKSGKKTSTSTRNKKRKNIIRGGMPFSCIGNAVIAALFTLAKNKNNGAVSKYMSTEFPHISIGPDQHFAYLNSLSDEQMQTLIHSDKCESDKCESDKCESERPVLELTTCDNESSPFDWASFNWDEFKRDEKTKQAMQRASGNTRLHRAVDSVF